MGALAAITSVVFILLFRNVPFGDVMKQVRAARAVPLILGALLTATFPVLSALRWRAVMGGLGRHLSLSEANSMVLACFTLSTFTPSKGGDIGRAWFLRGRVPMSTVLGSVFAERLLDVFTLLGFCFVGSLCFHWRTLYVLSGALLLGGAIVVAGLLLVRFPFPEKIRPRVERGLEALRVLLRRPALLAVVLIYTLLNWVASMAQAWFFYRSLGATSMPFGRVSAALPVAIFIGLLPITIAGMGTRDAALIRLLAGQASAPISLGVGMLYSICGYWIPGLVGLPFLRWSMSRRTS
jgi:hypothetical protein